MLLNIKMLSYKRFLLTFTIKYMNIIIINQPGDKLIAMNGEPISIINPDIFGNC